LAAAGYIVSLLASIVTAAPGLELAQLSKRQGITPLDPAQISSFKPFTSFASAAYCNPKMTAPNWSCGAPCDANSGFIPTASGGDGGSVQYWYVGYSPSEATVVVAHQGTNPYQLAANATDLNAFFTQLDTSRFPRISSDSPIRVHKGFANEQAKTAPAILSAVQTTIKDRGANSVTVVGHSLGAALALLDTVYLSQNIPEVSVRMVGYGLPRVGNQAFANYVDANLDVTHINNKKDPVPIVPGMFLGYHHPAGEVHIMANNQWVSCPGQDNPSTECIVGSVPTIFSGVVADHSGPYDGITMGIGCTAT